MLALLVALPALAQASETVVVEAALVDHCGEALEEARFGRDRTPAVYRALGALDTAGQVGFAPTVMMSLGEPARVVLGRRVPLDVEARRFHEVRTELHATVDAGEAADVLHLDLQFVDGEHLGRWQLELAPGEVLILPAFSSERRCRGGAEGRSTLVVVADRADREGTLPEQVAERWVARREGRTIEGRRAVRALLLEDPATRMLADPR